jgi:hypothetical protein
MNSKNSSKLVAMTIAVVLAVGATLAAIPANVQAAPLSQAVGGPGGSGGAGGAGGISAGGSTGDGGAGGAGGGASSNQESTIDQVNSCGENNESPNSGEQSAECIDQDQDMDQTITQEAENECEGESGDATSSGEFGFSESGDAACLTAFQDSSADGGFAENFAGGGSVFDFSADVISALQTCVAEGGSAQFCSNLAEDLSSNVAEGGTATGDPNAAGGTGGTNTAEVDQDIDQDATNVGVQDQDASVDQDNDADVDQDATNTGGDGGAGGNSGDGGDAGDASGGAGGSGGSGGDADSRIKTSEKGHKIARE